MDQRRVDNIDSIGISQWAKCSYFPAALKLDLDLTFRSCESSGQRGFAGTKLVVGLDPEQVVLLGLNACDQVLVVLKVIHNNHPVLGKLTRGWKLSLWTMGVCKFSVSKCVSFSSFCQNVPERIPLDLKYFHRLLIQSVWSKSLLINLFPPLWFGLRPHLSDAWGIFDAKRNHSKSRGT